MKPPENSRRRDIGTVAYMSPEQAQGRRVDCAFGHFSFGSVLYEMLTGERAFRGNSGLATLTAVLRDNPRSSRRPALDAPPELQEVVMRCLRKDPDQRYQSMADVKSSIEQIYFASRSGVMHSGVWKRPAARA